MTQTSRIATHLWYDNSALEAVNFYVSLLPNSRIIETFGFDEGGPERDRSFTSITFELDGQRYMALNGGPHFKLNEAVSIFVRCETQAEIDRLWSAFIDNGGRESQCGWLTDKYGLSWQIVPSMLVNVLRGGGEGSRRALQAMMKMVKLDIAELQKAHAG